MPLPPGQVPLVGQGHRHHRLGEQRERGDQAEQHGRRAPAVQQVEADAAATYRATAISSTSDRAGTLGRAAGCSSGGRPDTRETTSPDGEQEDEPDAQPHLRSQHGPGRPVASGRPRRPRRPRRASRPTGWARSNPSFGAMTRITRRGQRVQQQEPGAGQEHQRDQEEPGVGVPGGRADHGAEHHVDRRHGEDQPEVAGIVAATGCRVAGVGQQQPEAGHRQRQVQHPDHRAGRLRRRWQVRFLFGMVLDGHALRTQWSARWPPCPGEPLEDLPICRSTPNRRVPPERTNYPVCRQCG